MIRDITLLTVLDGTTRTVTDGKEVVPGIAVAPHPIGGWRLVHVRSGLTIWQRRTFDIEQAAAAAMALGAVRDWDCHGSEIVADESLTPHLRRVLGEWIYIPFVDEPDPVDLNVATT